MLSLLAHLDDGSLIERFLTEITAAGCYERADPAEMAFAAFYADCVHEVRPVTDGFRLTLTYNLIRRRPSRQVQVPDYAEQEACLMGLLQSWRANALWSGEPSRRSWSIRRGEHEPKSRGA
jgi:hypothetical protein